MSLRPFVTKLLEVAGEQMRERYDRHMGDQLASPPVFEKAWVEPEEKGKKWRVTWKLSIGRDTLLEENAWIFHRLSLKDSPFPEIYGLITAVTRYNRLFLPVTIEYGTVVDAPIPAGLFFKDTGWGEYSINVLSNRLDPDNPLEVNPFAELIRFESDQHKYNSRLVRSLDRLSTGEKWEGAIGLVGVTKKFEFKSSRTFTALPWGHQTIISSSSTSRYDGDHRFSYPSEGKQLGAKIVRPDIRDLEHHLGVLKQLDYLIKHINYSIESYADFFEVKSTLPKLITLEIRRNDLARQPQEAE